MKLIRLSCKHSHLVNCWTEPGAWRRLRRRRLGLGIGAEGGVDITQVRAFVPKSDDHVKVMQAFSNYQINHHAQIMLRVKLLRPRLFVDEAHRCFLHITCSWRTDPCPSLTGGTGVGGLLLLAGLVSINAFKTRRWCQSSFASAPSFRPRISPGLLPPEVPTSACNAHLLPSPT